MEQIDESLNHPELIFGLVAPIGVRMDEVQGALCDSLKQVGYDSNVIHLSEALRRVFEDPESDSSNGYDEKISRANAFCEKLGSSAAMAALACQEILTQRSKLSGKPPEKSTQIPRRAYIIRQLKRLDELNLLRNVYGEKFIQISVSVEKNERIRTLKHVLLRRDATLNHDEAENKARQLVEIDDHQTDQKYGQEVGEIFHEADYFLNGKNTDAIGKGVADFVRAFFGHNSRGPTKDEYGAYLASTAALRSIDLSRQVGAAILTKEGDTISLGCNEVPKASGGNYWSDDRFVMRDYEHGGEQNAVEKRRIVLDFISKLVSANIIDNVPNVKDEIFQKEVSDAVEDALVSDITEYGRMVHAEMNAVCDAARLGLSTKGATIFVTTFPCHNCAKHIVASGIQRVVYIEPYPKSRALTSHDDSISLSRGSLSKVIFEHFEGIAPRRYREVFQKGKRRRGSLVNTWYQENQPCPMIKQRDDVHISREAIAVSSVLSPLFGSEDNRTKMQEHGADKA